MSALEGSNLVTTRRIAVVGGLAGIIHLALAPLGTAPAAVHAAMPAKAVQVVGTVRRAPGSSYSLMIQTHKHSKVTVYFSSVTPLLNRTGFTIFGRAIKVGH